MRILSSAVSAVTIAAFALVAAAGQPAPADDLLERALALNRSAPLIDGHNDYPWAVREEAPTLDLAAVDIRGPQPLTMTDIPRLRAGGLGAQFWSVYVPASLQGQAATRTVLEQIDLVHRMVARYPDTSSWLARPPTSSASSRPARIASLIGVEGGHAIDNSLGTLRMLHALGAGYMTLTHADNVPWADAATDDATTRRALAVRRGSRARDEPARHARGPVARLARHDGRRPPGLAARRSSSRTRPPAPSATSRATCPTTSSRS